MRREFHLRISSAFALFLSLDMAWAALFGALPDGAVDIANDDYEDIAGVAVEVLDVQATLARRSKFAVGS